MPINNSYLDADSVKKLSFNGKPVIDNTKYGTTWEEVKNRDKPKDWKFMEEAEKVLANIPDTWKTYPRNEQGMCDIIDMEYKELKEAVGKENKKHELIHLASACLNLWRKLNNVE